MANIQIKKHVNAVPTVHKMDKLTLPIVSPNTPMVGRPIMIPAENIPVTTLPCCALNPIEMAKSDREYMTLTYPNKIANPQKTTDKKPGFRRSKRSKERYRAEMMFILSLRTMMTTVFTTMMQMAVIRKDHWSEMFSIIRLVQMENKRPPGPDPAAQIPIANARRLLNH